MRRLSSLIVLALALVLAAPLTAADSKVTGMLDLCQDARAQYDRSQGPELTRDRWLVSGDKTGSSRRFPEDTDAYVHARVTVELLRAGSFQAQSISGGPADDRWMLWFDGDSKQCLLLTGTEASMTGPDASLTTTADSRVFKHGELDLVFTLDTSLRAEDEGKLANGKGCRSGGECKSGLCSSSLCKACSATVACPTGKTCTDSVCQ